MSSPGDSVELKAGHAPAEKIAGGVRIARKEKHSESHQEPTNSPNESNETSDELEKIRDSNNVNSDLVKLTKIERPPEALSYIHNKPLPTHDNIKQHQGKAHHEQIFQPRRQ